MPNISSYVTDVLVFFWPPLIMSGAIGSLAAGRNRRLVGAAIGIAGGFVFGFAVMLMGRASGHS